MDWRACYRTASFSLSAKPSSISPRDAGVQSRIHQSLCNQCAVGPLPRVQLCDAAAQSQCSASVHSSTATEDPPHCELALCGSSATSLSGTSRRETDTTTP
ncbi:hypothetical protein IG631_00889 [Alternaria alternata]|nr:hypothetical protein IG631_00889 [Alternaria alternata]